MGARELRQGRQVGRGRQRAEYAGRGRLRRRALQAVISPAVAVLDRV